MTQAWVCVGCLVAAVWSGPALAQTVYRGYDIGPDYGRLLQEQLGRSQDLTERMQQTEAQIVLQTMQNPGLLAAVPVLPCPGRPGVLRRVRLPLRRHRRLHTGRHPAMEPERGREPGA